MAFGWSVAFGTLYAILMAFASWAVYAITQGVWENQTAPKSRVTIG